jgi:hypothetical protein
MPAHVVDNGSAASGIATLSLAEKGQVCQDICPGLPDTCALTGKAKSAPLFELLENALHDSFDLVSILVPVSLGSGLGALSMERVVSLAEEIQKKTPATIAIATSSECHGVIYCGIRPPGHLKS